NANLGLPADRRDLLEKLFPNATYTELDLHVTNAINLKQIQSFNKKCLDEKYAEDDFVFFIPSLFENEVTPVFPEKGRKILLAYDLIPIVFYDRYLAHSEPVRNNYFGRFSVIFEADHIFAISQTTADDFTRQLGLPEDMLTTIDGARIDLSETVAKPGYIP